MGGMLCCFDTPPDYSSAQDVNHGYHDPSNSPFMEYENQSRKSSEEELVSMPKKKNGAALDPIYFPSPESVEECAICLEEYDSQNPKAPMQCKHYFHLPCVLEWAQRSAACPLCNQEFVLEEQS